ncbi:monovalent cation/H(+) antiporter subunit G [Halorubellus salinus]|uniref:monovalent cation/H(+) antiporter subunit G n=1 Tax=Halorubellus salinus TaxID=755309 RepID=UPI0034A44C0B
MALAAAPAMVPAQLAWTPTAIVVAALVAASAFFSFVAVVGFYRLPDVYARAHAASKSETLGALFGLAAAGVVVGTTGELFKLVLLALLVLVTGPTAAHAIVRSAYDAGTEPWTHDDEDEAGGTDGDATVATDGGQSADHASSVDDAEVSR